MKGTPMNPLTASPDPAAVNQQVTISGSGFKSAGGKNTLIINVIGSPVPVAVSADASGHFTGTTTIPLAGSFVIVAWQVHDFGGPHMDWTQLGQTVITVA